MLRAFFLAVCVVVVAGCPAAQVRETKPERPPEPPPVIVGAWQSDCFPVINADETEGSAKVTLGVKDANWGLDMQLFGDDTCGQATGTLHEDGGYALVQPSAVAGAWELRLDVRTRTVTPHVDGFIYYLQAVSCGDAYKVNRATDILDLACPALGAQPFATCAVGHDLVALDGESLRLGQRPADGNICSEAQRPQSLGRPLRKLP